MPKILTEPSAADPAAVACAKRLMRLARTGALATLEQEGGPLTTLVGVASDFDGAPLFLMSALSRHTRNLVFNDCASLLLTEKDDRGDPLNHPRLTLSGRIERSSDPRAGLRYLRRNPKARLYSSFADFAYFRLTVESAHFNGGFGRASPMAPTDILASREGEDELSQAEPRLLDQINAREGAVTRLAGTRRVGRQIWRAVGLDGEGLDLACGGRAGRAQFLSPAHSEAAWRARIEELVDVG